MFNTRKFTLVIAAALALSACGPEKASFDTVETNRANAKANAEYNAQAYRAGTVAYANYALEVQGDSTQSPTCPQGDGWASAKLVNKDNPNQKFGLKCSTVSSTVGCMPEADFKTKSYATDDGKCQATDKVPFPIPKIAK